MDRQGWNDRYATAELVWTAGPNRTFAEVVGDLPPGTALDLGTGEGRNAIWLAEQGWQVTALDFSDVAIGKLRTTAKSNDVEVATIVTDVTTYAPPPSTFDLIAVIYLHLPASIRTDVHRRAAAALTPGGTLVVLGHDTTNLTGGHGGPQDPEVLFTPDDLVSDLASTGLVTVRAERVERVVNTPDGEGVAIDALMRAMRPTE